jgi:hypothetical protein
VQLAEVRLGEWLAEAPLVDQATAMVESKHKDLDPKIDKGLQW